jgi:RND family efflux transporter MFP subunit
VFVALAAVVVVTGWWFTHARPIAVHTVRVRDGGPTANQGTLLNASGYVTARRAATVSSKVTGKIVEVLVEEGTPVKVGQELARLDASNTAASLELTRAQLAAARRSLDETNANLSLAEVDLRRQRDLAAKHTISQSELDRAEAAALSLHGRHERELAEITVAERQVAIWEQQLDDTIIRAPFDGVVTSKNAQPGEMISPMSSGGFTRTGVCTLVDMSSLEIEIDVNESYINRVEPGQRVDATLDSYPDWKIPAHVIAIIPSADRQKATVKVRVGFEKLDPRILPDMGVKVAFQSTGTPASAAAAARTVVVPGAAVRTIGGREIIFVASDGRAERRAVTIAAKNGDDVVLSAGVSAGESIVLDAPESLADGAAITEARP